MAEDTTPEPEVAVHAWPSPSVADGTVDADLVAALRDLGGTYGPRGVADVAAELAHLPTSETEDTTPETADGRTPQDDTTPAQLATFDQRYAALSGFIDYLIKGYRGVRAENAAVRGLDIAGLSGWLQETDHDRTDFAELLTVAVVRLAEQENRDHTT